jgi:hypothetical protein
VLIIFHRRCVGEPTDNGATGAEIVVRLVAPGLPPTPPLSVLRAANHQSPAR